MGVVAAVMNKRGGGGGFPVIFHDTQVCVVWPSNDYKTQACAMKTLHGKEKKLVISISLPHVYFFYTNNAKFTFFLH